MSRCPRCGDPFERYEAGQRYCRPCERDVLLRRFDSVINARRARLDHVEQLRYRAEARAMRRYERHHPLYNEAGELVNALATIEFHLKRHGYLPWPDDIPPESRWRLRLVKALWRRYG
jgi:hypothetical protein